MNQQLQDAIKEVACEEWRPIDGYPYLVSSLGNVKSLNRLVNSCYGSKMLIKSKVLKQHNSKNGYKVVKLFKNNNGKHFLVHRLVAMAFVKKDDGNEYVNHINGIKTDNRSNNLEWVTMSENVIHAQNIGLKKDFRGKKVLCLIDGHTYNSVREASEKIGISAGTLRSQLNRKSKTAILKQLTTTSPKR